MVRIVAVKSEPTKLIKLNGMTFFASSSNYYFYRNRNVITSIRLFPSCRFNSNRLLVTYLTHCLRVTRYLVFSKPNVVAGSRDISRLYVFSTESMT